MERNADNERTVVVEFESVVRFGKIVWYDAYGYACWSDIVEYADGCVHAVHTWEMRGPDRKWAAAQLRRIRVPKTGVTSPTAIWGNRL